MAVIGLRVGPTIILRPISLGNYSYTMSLPTAGVYNVSFTYANALTTYSVMANFTVCVHGAYYHESAAPIRADHNPTYARQHNRHVARLLQLVVGERGHTECVRS